jgi:hypothetical protein
MKPKLARFRSAAALDGNSTQGGCMSPARFVDRAGSIEKDDERGNLISVPVKL